MLVADALCITVGLGTVGVWVAVGTLEGSAVGVSVGVAGELSEAPHAAKPLIINTHAQTRPAALHRRSVCPILWWRPIAAITARHGPSRPIAQC